MAAGRTLRSLISRRRRIEDEGEDEEGPVVVEDSQSEGSVITEPEDEEGDASSFGNAAEVEGGAAPSRSGASPTKSESKKTRKPRKRLGKKGRDAVAEPAQAPPNFKAMANTEAMMNGLGIGQEEQDAEAADFETMRPIVTAAPASATTNGHHNTVVERQRREHEEYKKKRDSDPAFIPNRGNFFMHDTRGQVNGQPPPLRGAWQGRGRGRGGANIGGPFSPVNQMAQNERASEQQWKHDLHDTINEEPPAQSQPLRPADVSFQQRNGSNSLAPRPAAPPNQDQPRVVSFSQTTLVGRVQIHVSLPGMKTPTTFSEVPWKHYTRLPDHRPPLRRDKPVRLCLPGLPPRYIFPATDRSFIFIPRQNRPNQQGFHRGQYQRSIGGYGYSSRRTSMYGGSIYSGSVPPSRRGSFVGPPREHAFSPASSFAGMPSSRPIGRLPSGGGPFSAHSTPIGPLSGHQTPTGMPQIHTYPPPQQPAHFGTPTTTVHQPRPQKAISVTGIESPMLQQDPQPFQNQLPAHMNEPPPPYFSPQHRYPQPQSQPNAGTPLSGIPEMAVHAPAFQPPGFNQPHFYPSYPPPQSYYYPPPQANGYPPQMHMYMMQPPHQAYMGPAQGHPMPQQQQQHVQQSQPPPPQSRDEQAEQQQAPSGMVAHESHGMVFYVPASEAQQSDHYQPAESFVPSWAMPGLPPPTPAPEGSTSYYYPPPAMQQQQPPPGMQEVGSGVYYPAQPQQ